MAKVAEAPQLYKQSMEEFFKMAKYPLVRQCDMSAEMKEEAMDVCITAVEKFPHEREKCTQVRFARNCARCKRKQHEQCWIDAKAKPRGPLR